MPAVEESVQQMYLGHIRSLLNMCAQLGVNIKILQQNAPMQSRCFIWLYCFTNSFSELYAVHYTTTGCASAE